LRSHWRFCPCFVASRAPVNDGAPRPPGISICSHRKGQLENCLTAARTALRSPLDHVETADQPLRVIHHPCHNNVTAQCIGLPVFSHLKAQRRRRGGAIDQASACGHHIQHTREPVPSKCCSARGRHSGRRVHLIIMPAGAVTDIDGNSSTCASSRGKLFQSGGALAWQAIHGIHPAHRLCGNADLILYTDSYITFRTGQTRRLNKAGGVNILTGPKQCAKQQKFFSIISSGKGQHVCGIKQRQCRCWSSACPTS